MDSDALLCYRIGCAAGMGGDIKQGGRIGGPSLSLAAIDWHEPVVGFLPAKGAKVNDYKVEWAWI